MLHKMLLEIENLAVLSSMSRNIFWRKIVTFKFL